MDFCFSTVSVNVTQRFRRVVAHLKGGGAERELVPEALTEGRRWVDPAEPIKQPVGV